MKKIWPFSFYFLILAGAAAYRPYLVLYYQSLSFTGAQIGLLAGIAPLITVVSLPLVTGFADRTNRHKLILSLLLLVVVAGLVLFPYFETFILLFGLVILNRVAFSPIMPLSDSATMFMLGNRRDLYGRIRLGGTIGFSIVATVAGSLVENYGLKIAFWSAASLFFRFNAYSLLIFSIAMTGLRFLLLAVVANPTIVLFVQLLNGFNYPLLTVAGVTYADEHAPQGFRATAQGVFNVSVGGIGSAIGGFAGGLLFESVGAKGMYLTFCIFIRSRPGIC